MPVETTERAIKYIFNTINSDICVSDVRVAQGKQRRHDRWQLMVECNDIQEIPHSFILPNMGPEYEDLKIKVFVEGRQAFSDTSPPLPSHQASTIVDTQIKTPERASTPLAQSASLSSTTENRAPAKPSVKSHPPTNTPSNRPRPTPSPNEGQPFMKKVKPQDKGVLGKEEPAPSAEEEHDPTCDAVSRARIKASYEEKVEANRQARERRAAEVEMRKQQRKRNVRNSDVNGRKIDSFFSSLPRV